MEPQEIISQSAEAYQRALNSAMAAGSEIADFYNNTTIFVTGGSGFLGKQLIEKLFRSCNIKKAYVLIRAKKGKSTQERFQAMLSDDVFNAVRKIKPKFDSLLVPVEGDIAELRLGIADDNWKTLSEEVDVIFNMAATIRFDEKLKTATLVNIRGTRETVKLAKACRKLKTFVHVSTAYCHTTAQRVGGEVLEQFYPSPILPETMIDMAENMEESRLDAITPSLIKDWPNTYCFTKAIAEEVVRKEAGNLCVAIVRPSIVLATYREPEPAWIDVSCMYGPSGFVLGVALGVIRVIFVRSTSKLSFVPVDFVNNATIAAGWDAATRQTDVPTVYHVSSTNCGVTFRHVSVPMRGEKIRSFHTPKAIWYGYLIETDNNFFYWILSWLLHYIPAYVVDGVIKIFKIRKPKELKSFIKVYDKVNKLSKIFGFFLVNEWNFNDTNLLSLYERMSQSDKTSFNFDIKSINWDDYTLFWVLGIRKYMIRDDFKISKSAVKKQKVLKIANYAIALMYLFVFWKIFSFGFRCFC